jgi:hypothetical protein
MWEDEYIEATTIVCRFLQCCMICFSPSPHLVYYYYRRSMRDELMKIEASSMRLCDVDAGADISALFIEKCRLYR